MQAEVVTRGSRYRQVRELAGLTQEQLGTAIGKNKVFASRIENDPAKLIDVDIANAWAGQCAGRMLLASFARDDVLRILLGEEEIDVRPKSALRGDGATLSSSPGAGIRYFSQTPSDLHEQIGPVGNVAQERTRSRERAA